MERVRRNRTKTERIRKGKHESDTVTIRSLDTVHERLEKKQEVKVVTTQHVRYKRHEEDNGRIRRSNFGSSHDEPICYVCKKIVEHEYEMIKTKDKDAKGKTKYVKILIKPLCVGHDRLGRPVFRHRADKCTPGSNFYIKKGLVKHYLKDCFEAGLKAPREKKEDDDVSSTSE